MALLAPAFAKTANHETSGFKNVDQRAPDDPGGETVIGVSRVNNPDASIWAMVDEIKKFNGQMPLVVNSALRSKLEEVKERIIPVYEKKYWDPLKLNDCPSQPVAEILFDMKVLGGKPALWLVRSLNLLNLQGKHYPDQKEMDITPATWAAVEICQKKNLHKALVGQLLALRAVYLMERAEANPTKEKYIAGWINRIVAEAADYLQAA